MVVVNDLKVLFQLQIVYKSMKVKWQKRFVKEKDHILVLPGIVFFLVAVHCCLLD